MEVLREAEREGINKTQDSAKFADLLIAADPAVRLEYAVAFFQRDHGKFSPLYVGVATALTHGGFPAYLMPSLQPAPPYTKLGAEFTKQYLEQESDHDFSTMLDVYRMIKPGSISKLVELVMITNEFLTAVPPGTKHAYSVACRSFLAAVNPDKAYVARSKVANIRVYGLDDEGNINIPDDLVFGRAEAEGEGPGPKALQMLRALAKALNKDDDDSD